MLQTAFALYIYMLVAKEKNCLLVFLSLVTHITKEDHRQIGDFAELNRIIRRACQNDDIITKLQKDLAVHGTILAALLGRNIRRLPKNMYVQLVPMRSGGTPTTSQ